MEEEKNIPRITPIEICEFLVAGVVFAAYIYIALDGGSTFERIVMLCLSYLMMQTTFFKMDVRKLTIR